MRYYRLHLVLLLSLFGFAATVGALYAHSVVDSPANKAFIQPSANGNIVRPPFIPVGEFGYGYEFDYRYEFVASGDYVYVTEQSRLRVLSFAEGEHGRVVSEIFHPTDHLRRPKYIELSGDGTRLLVASDYSVYIPYPQYQYDLMLYDVSNPAAPRLLDREILPHYAYQMTVLGNRLYVQTQTQQGVPTIRIYGWQNDELTVRSESEVAAGFSNGRLFLDGTTLVMASYINTNSRSDIQLYDVSDEDALTYIGAVPSLGGVAMAANGYLYVRNGDLGGAYLDVWDIRNPASPTVVQSYSDFDYYPLAVRGNRMIWTGLYLYDISNPADLRVIDGSSYRLEQLVWSDANTLYGFGEDGLERVAITDPFRLVLQRNYPLPNYENGVAVDGRYLYLFNRAIAGIEIVDVQESNHPRWVGTALEGEFAEAPTPRYLLAEQRLYLRRDGDIAVIDVSDPIHPTLIGVVPFEGNWELETVANGHLFARLPVSNLMYILRLSDYVGKVIVTDGDGACSGFDTEGNYLAALCEEVLLYDISAPMEPVLVGSLQSPLEFLTPELAFPYLYATSKSQLAIYDLSNPTQPTYLTSISNPDSTLEPCKALIPLRERFYLRRCPSGRADIINLTNPLSVVRSDVGTLPSSNITVQGDFITVIEEEFQSWQIRLPLAHQVALPVISTP